MKIFLDCGSHVGNIIKKIRNNYDKIYAWECNDFCNNFNYGNNVIRYHDAVWIYDGEVEFNINSTDLSIQGHSIYSDKITGDLNSSKKVTCIDFSNWLKTHIKYNDFVTLKMDIEGAEYEVLKKCITDGTINLINELYVEWHYNKIPSIGKHIHDKMITALKNTHVKIFKEYHTINNL